MEEDPLEAEPLNEIQSFLPEEVLQTPDTQQPGWFRRNRVKLAIGATAASGIVGVAVDPFGDTVDRLREAAPYVVTGLSVGEVAWIGGAAMMLAAVGDKIGNPLRVKKRVPELADKANKSFLFKAGLALNTAAAVGQTTALSTGVVLEMPVKSWGLLALGAADLWATIVVRRAIVRGVRNNRATEATD